MTYKVVKFATQPAPQDGRFRVAWCGDLHPPRILDIAVTSAKYQENGADAAELFAMWLVLVHWENAGQRRTAKNLKLEVSRGAVKKLLRADSAKVELNSLAYFGRTQFFGVEIEVVKKTPWVDWAEPSTCSAVLGDDPLPRPTVSVPGVGDVGITLHALEEYIADTGGDILSAHVYGRIAERLRGSLREVKLSERVAEHKTKKHGLQADKTRIMVDDHGWQYVLLQVGHESYVLKTVYNRGRAY